MTATNAMQNQKYFPIGLSRLRLTKNWTLPETD